MTVKKLGRYDIIRTLGKGAMGLVYEGKDSVLQRRVAIKTIIVENLDSKAAEEYESRFRTEALAAALASSGWTAPPGWSVATAARYLDDTADARTLPVPPDSPLVAALQDRLGEERAVGDEVDRAVRVLRDVELAEEAQGRRIRERLAAEVYGAGARVAHVPNVGGTPENAQVWSYDPAVARSLFGTSAEGAPAAPAHSIVLTHAESAPDELVARVVEDLRAVGLAVELEAVPSTWAVWRDRSQRGLLLHTVRADEDSDARRWCGRSSAAR